MAAAKSSSFSISSGIYRRARAKRKDGGQCLKSILRKGRESVWAARGSRERRRRRGTRRTHLIADEASYHRFRHRLVDSRGRRRRGVRHESGYEGEATGVSKRINSLICQCTLKSISCSSELVLIVVLGSRGPTYRLWMPGCSRERCLRRR